MGYIVCIVYIYTLNDVHISEIFLYVLTALLSM